MKTKIIGIMLCTLLITTVGLPSLTDHDQGTSGFELQESGQQLQANRMLQQALSSSVCFTENKGQYPDEVLFQTQSSGVMIFLCKDKIVTVFATETMSNSLPSVEKDRFTFRKEPLPLDVTSVVTRFEGINAAVNVLGSDPASHCNNYFLGNDPTKWYTDVPNYRTVTYQDIYPGINLKYYGTGGALKYDFIVQPGADPSLINIRYEGMQRLEKTAQGDLIVTTGLGSFTEKAPVIWQEIAGARMPVSGQYVTDETGGIHFGIKDHYNPEYPLVIDPTLQYCTFLGGSSSDYGYGIAVDGSGRAYVTGYTYSWEFPMVNPYNGTFSGYSDVFITKFSSSGTTLVYSTYLGGYDEDIGYGIAVDSSGRAYLTGYTQSSNFPIQNAYDGSFSGYYDVFVAKLSAAGNTLVYSTYLGGINHDYSEAIAVDGTGCAYITGDTSSYDYPVVNAYDSSYNGGDHDVFVTKLSSTGTSLVYSTYLGGIHYDYSRDIAVDSLGNAYVTGYTMSSDFPMKNPFDGTFNYDDVFVTKLAPAGNTLVYSTYLGGGGGEYANGIAVDASGNVYLTGYTYSWDFPLVNPYDDTINDYDVFVTKLSSGGDALIYSTFLGGTSSDYGYRIAVDATGNACVTGVTLSSDFPMVDPYNGTYGGYYDAFIAKLSAAGNTLVYSTYLGGNSYDYGFDIAVDTTGNAYLTGFTQSPDFPVVNPYNDTLNGWMDVYVAKFVFGTANQPPAFGTPSPVNGSANQPLSLTWGIPINDPNGDQFSYTIQCSNGQTKSRTNQTNGTKSLSLTGLAYSTTYKVWVNATDPSPGSGLYTRQWYSFSTAQNQPPNKPKKPTGPATRLTGQAGTYWANGTDPDGDKIQYRFDWNASGSHSYSSWTSLVNSGIKVSKNHTWTVAGTYVVKVQSKDEHGATSTWSNGLNVTVTMNQAPNQPQKPTGPTTRGVGQVGTYWANGTDPDGDKIQYRFDWNASGSHQYSTWTTLVNSGTKQSKTHSWAVPGAYVVKVQSRDEHGAISVWSSGLTVVVSA